MNTLNKQQKHYFTQPLSKMAKQINDDSECQDLQENNDLTNQSITIIHSLSSRTIIEHFRMKNNSEKNWKNDFIWL